MAFADIATPQQPVAEPLEDPRVESPERSSTELSDQEVVRILQDYWGSAKEARESGLSARDTEWQQNWDAYWSRYDYSGKEDWQAQESLPDVQDATDRFAAAIRERLIQTPKFYGVTDPGDPQNQITDHIEKFMSVVLDRVGRDACGHELGFDAVFGDIVKSGVLMALCAQVRPDDRGGVIVECIDAREIYFDPTMRGLFRIRRYEMDWHKLMAMAESEDSPYDAEAVRRLQGQTGGNTERREELATSSGGTVDPDATSRQTVELLEFYCDLVSQDGELVAEGQQCVLANGRELVLPPRDNPFIHGRDWIVYLPIITIPFSVYGRSFVEGFRKLVDTYVDMTNLVLDAGYVGSMRAFQVWLQALDDPSQADSMSPMKTFIASDEVPYGTDFVKPVEMGSLSPSTLAIWDGLRSILRNAQQQNELSLGQLAPNAQTTRAEVTAVDRGQTQLVRNAVRDIDARFLSPLLDLIWSTAIQFLPDNDPQLAAELGQETYLMLLQQKEAFQQRRYKFKANGLTEAIERNERVKQTLFAIQAVSQSPQALQVFMQEYSMSRLMEQFFRDVGIDLTEMRLTEKERAQQQQALAAAQLTGAGQGGPGGGPGGFPNGGRRQDT